MYHISSAPTALIGVLFLSACDGGGSSNPAPSVYPVSGTLSGLNMGAQITLQNNAGDSTTVQANGPFSFTAPIPNGGSYAVTVATQPLAQTCTVSAGAGSGVVANVTDVTVMCGPATASLLYAFGANPADGSAPSSLIQGRDGNFYGTTSFGGTNASGTVFKVTPAGDETVLYSFADATAGAISEGAAPFNLIQGSDGNFYGLTNPIGAGNVIGTVFKITPAGVETVIHSFLDGTADGSNPSALIQGSDGNLYGTTACGGTTGDNLYSCGNGTVFKITPAGDETVLYAFAGGTADGINPGVLIQGSDGNIYGITIGGGTNGNGTLFKITPAGVETVLYSFAGPSGSPFPIDLIQGSDGNFYGVTACVVWHDGCESGEPTVFEITPAGVETVLYSSAGTTSATYGTAPIFLIQGSDGNFYGTTFRGGTSDIGTVFKITPAGVETEIYSFAGGAVNGSNPIDLILGSDGNFYGVTFNGGANNAGAVFKF